MGSEMSQKKFLKKKTGNPHQASIAYVPLNWRMDIYLSLETLLLLWLYTDIQGAEFLHSRFIW